MSNFYLVQAGSQFDISQKRYVPRGEVITCSVCKYRGGSECWANRLFTCDSDFCSRGVKREEAEPVEVVRCKDCKHYIVAEDGFCWCELTNSGAYDDAYCAWGKKK